MKKILCILVLLAMLASLAACKGSKPEIIEPEPEPPVEFDPDTFELYTIFTGVHENNNIRIEYPQINELLDRELQARINTIIEAWALEILQTYDYEDTLEHINIDIEYEVTRSSDNLLSIVFRGTAFTENMPHPGHILYTVNVDTVVGVEVALIDMIVLGDEFVQIFREHGTAARIPEAEEYIKDNDDEYLLGMFRNSDMFDDSGTFSYYTDDAVVISFYVPHVIGGYAEFEINYSDLAEILHEWRL
ncbi:MAG: DUF4163 domain-containing protein [Oscillospiraceae bacterium]|jgi:hypothetical protein|nr:DUF4163 domain-containing protein [Oscillospiraceae bacterium]